MFVFLVPIASVVLPAPRCRRRHHVPANEQESCRGALTSLMSITAILDRC